MKTQNLAKSEPNAEIASGWWPNVRYIWTPVGWKDHIYRFNVLWNGTIFSKLGKSKSPEFEGLDAQYTFSFTKPGEKNPEPSLPRDTGVVRQGWTDSPAPVLWTEWNLGFYYGIIVRKNIFAFLPEGKESTLGNEAIYAWVRIYIHDIFPYVPIEKKLGMAVEIEASHIVDPPMYKMDKSIAEYPRKLFFPKGKINASQGAELKEKGNHVRLGILPSPETRASWVSVSGREKKSGENGHLYLEMPIKKGKYVDLLLTSRPVPLNEYRKVAVLGYDSALKIAEKFWKNAAAVSKTTVSVPEKYINEMLRNAPRLAMMTGRKFPSGEYILPTGCLRYEIDWSTQTCWVMIMNLDILGYHDLVNNYLETYRLNQGKAIPPSKYLKKHPGFLSLPKKEPGTWSLAGPPWITHHGSILWAVCQHAALSGDKSFIDRWTGAIIKACEFICNSRKVTNHPGVKGVMPPADGTDWEGAGNCEPFQRIWNDAWMYKGLISAVRFLTKISHFRAKEFAREADNYKKTFVMALRKRAKSYPKWKTSDGKEYQFVPPGLWGDEPYESRWEIYLDCGPLFLVFAELFDAADPFMEGTRRWFREGPPTLYKRFDTVHGVMPVLEHEMGSGEAAWSWNIFHSLALKDRDKYLEGMYSLAVGSVSRQTFTAVEERHCMRGLLMNTQTYFLRLAVVEEKGKELHLLKMVPLAWLQKDQETRFNNLPTEFGPVSLIFKLSRDRQRLLISLKNNFREQPGKIYLHIPPLPDLKEISLNRKIIKITKNQKYLLI